MPRRRDRALRGLNKPRNRPAANKTCIRQMPLGARIRVLKQLRGQNAAMLGQIVPDYVAMVIPNEKIKQEGYWAAIGYDPATGQPITTNEWIDRLAPKAWAVVAAGTCATYGGIHAMAGNPTGSMGLADYLGSGVGAPRPTFPS